MANLVITSTTNAIKVVFNDQPYFNQQDGKTYTKGNWRKDQIANILLEADQITVYEKNGARWFVSYAGTTGTFTVDSVDAVAPTSDSDLYDKLVALIS